MTKSELVGFAVQVSPFVAGVALGTVALEGAHRTFLGSWFFRTGPDAGPPWYFIGQDLMRGAWVSGAFFLLLLFTALVARRAGPTVWGSFGIAPIWFFGDMGRAVNIWLHTARVWTGPQATTSWPSFHDYLASQRLASDLSFVIGGLVAVWCLVVYARALRAERNSH